jgi:hypothetical protein
MVKHVPDEDEDESRRFIETAKELEEAGDVDIAEGEQALERLMRKAAPTR